MRLRFCPSPTGTPHVGLLRTALFNWAYARHKGGTFVFRIEDTDAARDSAESSLQLIEALRWLGLDWDEGVEVGGPYGPYRQSERFGIYAEVARALLEGGFAYESFSTPEEVEARHIAAGRPAQTGYDGYDRDLSAAQRDDFRAAGREPVLRFRMPDADIAFTDLVRGPVTFRTGSVPDFVLVRAGGQPLYTLTNPVDDAMMRISHVLRGEDLLSSTPRQIVLHRALVSLGLSSGVPEFGHLPYVMGEGNKKLSKRDPRSSLFHLRDLGFLPEGLVNYLALLGWSIASDRDVFSVEEMVAAFDIADVNPNPARFDLKKAQAINAAHLRARPAKELARRLVPYLHLASLVSSSMWSGLRLSEQDLLVRAAPLVGERLTLLDQAPALLGFFFVSDSAVVFEPEALAKLPLEASQLLDSSLPPLRALGDWTASAIHDSLNTALVDGLGVAPRAAFAPLRLAITGRRVSLPLFEAMEILGRDSSIARIDRLRETLPA
ncbi:MAG: glutamate--tRNA ligase [Bifidobacteriaceae bacterium]|nr:glutamate--tRNA ligase [Bifidobacteriaceae bacterium]